jgi:hypothetical protein
MSNSGFDRERFVPLFSLPTNIPASMDYRRGRQNARWWSRGSPNFSLIVAAGMTLTLCMVLGIVTFFFVAPDPSLKLVLPNRDDGHHGDSRAMATSMHDRRFIPKHLKKQRGHRDPVLTCTGLFIFFGLLIVFTT